jgi:glutathione S-transferase
MKLHCTITSPYARKVWVVAHETGLADRIERIPTNPHRDEYLRQDNPLCRVPTLLMDDGEALFDSPVICEYLDSLHDGHKLFPASGAARWRALRLQALGDGLLDANLARRMESLRPAERQFQPWTDRQLLALGAAYVWLASRIEQLRDVQDGMTIGHVAVACALGYTEVRFPDDDWRQRYPQLADWYSTMEERPSMVATRYLTLRKTLPPEMIKEGPATHL